jgi:5-methylcytosine-specific restriction protein A
MPFVVRTENHGGENHYVFYPDNEGKELFEVDVHIQNRVRVVIHIYPQLHAGNMLSDMSHASQAKLSLFCGFAQALKEKGAKVSLLIDQSPASLNEGFAFPISWHTFDLRITKMAAYDETTDSEIEVISDWAIVAVSMVMSLLNVTDVESEPLGFAEGSKYQVVVNKYERNTVNRELCLTLKGYRCNICGFDFEAKYGSIGRHFIHVHHITPVSKIGPDYIIDPSKDLIPVCPNCHAMLHRKDPPYTPEEVLEMISKKKNYPKI